MVLPAEHMQPGEMTADLPTERFHTQAGESWYHRLVHPRQEPRGEQRNARREEASFSCYHAIACGFW